MSDPKKSPPPQAWGVPRIKGKPSTISADVLQRYLDSGSLITIQPGEVLVEQGTEPSEMYSITAGVLEVVMDGVRVAELEATTIVGEMAFLLGKPHTATVRALSECYVHAISPKKMAFLLRNHPGAVIGIMTTMALRVEAANRALKLRTETAMNDRLALEEEKRAHAATQAQLTAALGNLEPGNARIAQLEQALDGLGYELKPDGALIRRFAKPEAPPATDALEMDEVLDLLAPPPAPVPPPLPARTPRVDETRSYAIAAKPPISSPDVFAEVDTAELTVLEEPARGPVQAPRQRTVPVGARTQTMAAFDPDAPRQEIIVDERGSRPSQPTIERALESETDALLSEILSMSPDAQPKKG